MKNFLMGLLVGLILTATGMAMGADGIKLIVNGKEVACDPAPQMISDRVFVPVRFVSEALGAKVDWDDSRNAVVVSAGVNEEDTVALVDSYFTCKDYGVTLNGKVATFVFTVRNTSRSTVFSNPKYTVLFYDAENNLVGNKVGSYETFGVMLPGQTGAAFGSAEVTGAPVKMSVQLSPEKTLESKGLSAFTSTDVRFGQNHVYANIHNPYNKSLENVKVVAVLYNSSGNIIGGDTGYISFTPFQTVPLSIFIQEQLKESVSKVEVYPIYNEYQIKS